MPLQVYECKKCMKLYEIIVPLDKSDKEIKCPHCKKKLNKIVSAPYFKVR